MVSIEFEKVRQLIGDFEHFLCSCERGKSLHDDDCPAMKQRRILEELYFEAERLEEEKKCQ